MNLVVVMLRQNPGYGKGTIMQAPTHAYICIYIYAYIATRIDIFDTIVIDRLSHGSFDYIFDCRKSNDGPQFTADQPLRCNRRCHRLTVNKSFQFCSYSVSLSIFIFAI